MPNLELEEKRDLSAFRKIAIGTWRTAYDPSVYGSMDVRMDRALEYIAAFRRATGKRLTVTHLVARAVAEAFRRQPEANALLRFNRLYLRRRVGVFLQVGMPDEKTGKIDLSGVTIHDAADKTLAEIVDEMEQRVAAVRERRDPALESTRGMFRFVPYALLNPVLQAISFCAYTLNLDLSRFGIPRDAFGSVMVTNVGSLGLDTAYVPLIPWSRVPMLIAVGAVRDAPVAEGGVVVVRKVLGLHATFDHRFIDGLHAAAMSRLVRDWLENPFERFGPLPPAPAPGGAGR